MRNYIKISDPGVSLLVKAAFPDFRGRKLSWSPVMQFKPAPTYWDGGTKHTYVAVQLSTLKAVRGMEFDPPQFGGPAHVNPIVMVPDVAIVEHTHFGASRLIHIYVHPQDAPKLITEGVSHA